MFERTYRIAGNFRGVLNYFRGPVSGTKFKTHENLDLCTKSRGGWTRSHDMKSKWSHATNSRYLMYSSSSSPFICPVELDQWYHSKELALTISERPSTPSNPYVPEELWPLENCGGCGRMARNSQNAPNCRRHNSIHHL